MNRFSVVLEQQDRKFYASSNDFPGLIAVGDSEEAVRSALLKMILQRLDAIRADTEQLLEECHSFLEAA